MSTVEELFEIFRSASENCKRKFLIFDPNLFKNDEEKAKIEEECGKFLRVLGMRISLKKSNYELVCSLEKGAIDFFKSKQIFVDLGINEKQFNYISKICVESEYEDLGYLNFFNKASKKLQNISNNTAYYTILKFFYIMYKTLSGDIEGNEQYKDMIGMNDMTRNFIKFGDEWLNIVREDENYIKHSMSFPESLQDEIILYYGKIKRKISELKIYNNVTVGVDRTRTKTAGNILTTNKCLTDKKALDKVQKFMKNKNNEVTKLVSHIFIVLNYEKENYIVHNAYDHTFLKLVSPNSKLTTVTLDASRIGTSETLNTPELFLEILKETWEYIKDKDVTGLYHLADVFTQHEYFALRNHFFLMYR